MVFLFQVAFFRFKMFVFNGCKRLSWNPEIFLPSSKFSRQNCPWKSMRLEEDDEHFRLFSMANLLLISGSVMSSSDLGICGGKLTSQPNKLPQPGARGKTCTWCLRGWWGDGDYGLATWWWKSSQRGWQGGNFLEKECANAIFFQGVSQNYPCLGGFS